MLWFWILEAVESVTSASPDSNLVAPAVGRELERMFAFLFLFLEEGVRLMWAWSVRFRCFGVGYNTKDPPDVRERTVAVVAAKLCFRHRFIHAGGVSDADAVPAEERGGDVIDLYCSTRRPKYNAAVWHAAVLSEPGSQSGGFQSLRQIQWRLGLIWRKM